MKKMIMMQDGEIIGYVEAADDKIPEMPPGVTLVDPLGGKQAGQLPSTQIEGYFGLILPLKK
ncbi:hypothetical protein [Bradyrhizobium elkanii]|uniref:hypothetical protein n=1 Tax=Bradyrhizobium elkanii TaxID=29448 RepID=UPI0004AD42B4|nr:hypothetical protein [Bradyrhizobium elkanii]WLA79562.1 hypothetical protein QNJ99_29720 [Bradyrhizobium elkanii]